MAVVALSLLAAPGANANAGSVRVPRSTSSGVTPKDSFAFGAGTVGTDATGARLGLGFND
ncbi:hypothetical protein [Streptomyces sp. NPDC002769]|uniref:hypothetical protein n=1 Tax=Streptomyces sp. NPDC002769 TaxID=3154542 RepID=UPI00332D76D2